LRWVHVLQALLTPGDQFVVVWTPDLDLPQLLRSSCRAAN